LERRQGASSWLCVAKTETGDGKPAGANFASRSLVVQFSKVRADGVWITRWTAFDFRQNRR
jgi:hypothetical protein